MKKYVTMQEWVNSGVFKAKIYKKEDQHRILSNMQLPHLIVKTIDGSLFGTDEFKNQIEGFLNQTKPTVLVSSPKLPTLPKHAIDNVSSWQEVEGFMNKLPGANNYNILITEMVTGTENGTIGIAVSDGNGRLLLEFYKRPFWTDIRELSSGCSEPVYQDLAFVNNSEIKVSPKKIDKNDVLALKEHLHGKRGYFEFIKGKKNGTDGIYFIEFQDDPIFMNVLKLFN